MKKDRLTSNPEAPEAPAPSPVEPPAQSPLLRPSGLLGAVVTPRGEVFRLDLEHVDGNDLEEVCECSSIIVRNQIGLERCHRAGLHDWRRTVHTAEIDRAVARLQELKAFVGPVPDDHHQADERRPG